MYQPGPRAPLLQTPVQPHMQVWTRPTGSLCRLRHAWCSLAPPWAWNRKGCLDGLQATCVCFLEAFLWGLPGCARTVGDSLYLWPCRPAQKFASSVFIVVMIRRAMGMACSSRGVVAGVAQGGCQAEGGEAAGEAMRDVGPSNRAFSPW